MIKRAVLMTALVFAACDGDPSDIGDVPSLQTIDVTVGTGATAVAGKRVTVHYTGWLYNPNTADHKGEKFDSSRDRGTPFSFNLGNDNVIEGWHLGVAGMKVGGKRTLIIPSSLGYGPFGNGPIPGNAAIVFDIELLGVH